MPTRWPAGVRSCRLEAARKEGCAEDRYKRIGRDQKRIDRLLVELFVQAHSAPPEETVLDLDVTDTARHGHQKGRFFQGFRGHYCYLPLYIFSGQHLLCAGRDGEPDQRATEPVCRPGEHGHHARQPVAAVPGGDGLHTD